MERWPSSRFRIWAQHTIAPEERAAASRTAFLKAT
jgi:hypothetical protein